MSSYNPMMWERQMCCDYFNIQPSDVKGSANLSTVYWERYLLIMLSYVFKFKLPDTWSLPYFRYMLFVYGSTLVLYTDEYGWIFSQYGVTKLGLYYLPVEFLVSSQFLRRQYMCTRGYNSELIYCMDDRFGLMDLVRRHATQLAAIDKLIQQNAMTSGTGYVFFAKDKKSADTFKEAWGRQSAGEPLTIMCETTLNSSGNALEPFNPEVSKNYIINDLLLSRRTILSSYLSLIGIPTANYDKKERLTTAEVNRNDTECRAITTIVEENLKECFERVNAISGLSLSVERRGAHATIDPMGNVSIRTNIV